MNQQSKTLLNAIACIVIFVAFMGIFSALGIVMLVVGIYWAFQLAFTAYWWVSLIVMIGLLAAYVIGLVTALHYIERKTI